MYQKLVEIMGQSAFRRMRMTLYLGRETKHDDLAKPRIGMWPLQLTLLRPRNKNLHGWGTFHLGTSGNAAGNNKRHDIGTVGF